MERYSTLPGGDITSKNNLHLHTSKLSLKATIEEPSIRTNVAIQLRNMQTLTQTKPYTVAAYSQNHADKFTRTAVPKSKERPDTSVLRILFQPQFVKSMASHPLLTQSRLFKKRKRRYALEGSRWNKTIIKYKITMQSTKLSLQNQRDVMSSSFRVWAEVCPLKFQWVNDSTKADIKIQFTSSKCNSGVIRCSESICGML